MAAAGNFYSYEMTASYAGVPAVGLTNASNPVGGGVIETLGVNAGLSGGVGVFSQGGQKVCCWRYAFACPPPGSWASRNADSIRAQVGVLINLSHIANVSMLRPSRR